MEKWNQFTPNFMGVYWAKFSSVCSTILIECSICIADKANAFVVSIRVQLNHNANACHAYSLWTENLELSIIIIQLFRFGWCDIINHLACVAIIPTRSKHCSTKRRDLGHDL